MAVVAELEAIITADTSAFDAAMGQASGTLEEFASGAGSAANQLTTAGKAAVGLGAGILGMVGGAVMGAADFEFAMDAVNAALGGIGTTQMEALEEQALALGASSKFSATEVAGVQEELAKSGINAEQLLEGATKAVLDLAAATGEGLVPATKSVGSALNMFDLEASQASEVADIYTAALNNSNMSIDDMNRGLNYLGPVLANQNQYLNDGESAFRDAAGAISYFNQSGLKGADVGVSLARMFTNLAQEGSEADNELDRLGISAFDAENNFKPLPDLLDEINTAMSDMSDLGGEASIAKLVGAEAADVWNQAIKRGGDPLREHMKLMNEDGIAAKQAALRQDNLRSSVEMLGGALNGLAIEMGDPLLDPLNEITKGVTEMTEAIAGAPDPIQRLASQFGALSGGLLMFGGLSALGIGQALKLGETFRKAGLSLPLFSAGLLGIGAAIGAGLLAYETNFLGFRDKVDSAMQNAAKAIDVFGATFDEVFNANKAVGLSDMASAVGALGVALDAALGTNIAPLTRKIAEGMQRFGDVFEDVTGIMRDAGFNEVAASIAGLGYALDAALGTDVAPMFEELARAAQVFGKSWELAREAGIDPFTSALLASRDAIGELLGVDLAVPMDNFGAAMRSGVDGVGAFKDALLAGDWSTAWEGLTGGLDSVGLKIEEIDLSGKLQGVSDQVGDWFQDIGDQLLGREALGAGDKGAVEGIIPQLADDIVEGIRTLPQTIGEELGGVQDFFAPVGDWLGDQWDGLTRSLLGVEGVGPQGIPIEIPGIVDTLASGVAEGITQLPQAVGDKLAGTRDFFAPVGDWLGDQWDGLTTALMGVEGVGPQGIPIEVPGIVDRLASGVADGITQLPSMVGDKLAQTQDFFAPVGDWLGDQWDGLTRSLLGVEGVGPQGIPIEIPGIIDQLAEGVTTGITQLPQAIGEQLSGVQDFFQPVGDWLGKQWDGLSETLLGGTATGPQGIPIEVPGAIDQLSDGIVGGFQELPDLIGQGLKELESPLQAVGDWIQTQVSEDSSDFNSFKRTAMDAGTNLMNGVTDALTAGMAETQVSGGFHGPGGTESQKVIEDTLAGFYEDAITTIEQAGEVSPEFHKAAGDLGTATGKTLVDAWQTAFNQSVEDSAKDAQGGEAGAPSPGDSFKLMMDNMDKEAQKGIDEGTKDIRERLKAKAVDIGKNLLPDFAGEIVETMQSNLITGEKLPNPFEGLGDWLMESSQEASDLLFGEFDAQAGLGGTGGTRAKGKLETIVEDLEGVVKTLQDLPQMVETKIGDIQDLGNPFEGVGTWLESSWEDVTDFLAPMTQGGVSGGFHGPGGAGPLGAFESLAQNVSTGLASMGDSIMEALPDKNPFEGLTQQLGDWLGPLGQFLFPSEDTLAKEATLGDPAALGKQFGESLVSTFTDDAFRTGMEASIEGMPKETFEATGATLLGAINKGMETALMPGVMAGEGKGKLAPVVGPMGQKMVETLATGLTGAIDATPAETFQVAGGALLGALNEGMKTAFTAAAPTKVKGEAPATTMGQQMVQGLATGMTDSITAAPPEIFTPMANALGTQLGTALSTLQSGAQLTDEQIASGAGDMAAGGGLPLVQGLATGLTESIIAAPPELFVPMSSALGAKLVEAMSMAAQPVQPEGGVGPVAPASGMGTSMVTGLATGLAESITAAPAETFVPMSNALGAKLGEAMSLVSQPVTPVGGVGPVAPDSGVGTSMVQGLATGLTESIIAAPVEMFHPVSNALGGKLSESLKTAMTETVGVGEQEGGAVGADAAGGIGQQMVTGLATGLETSITDAPVETFAPAGAALGTKLSEALTTAAGATGEEGAAGTSDIGAQLGDAVGQAITGGVQEANWDTVGVALGTKIETLQTVAAGEGDFDVSEQVVTSVSEMMTSGIDGADFASVGDSLTTQLSDQMTTAIDEVSTQISEAMTGITEAISEAVGQMGEEIGKATEAVSTAVEEMSGAIEEATGAVSEAVGEMQTAVEEAATAMGEAATSAAEAATEIGTAAEEAATAVSTAMADMAASFASAAGAIQTAAAAVVAALNSIATAAASAGAAIGSALAMGAVGALGIGSPSKVFMEIGKNVTAGLVVGMNKNGAAVLRRGTTSLAKASVQGLSNAIGMGSPAKKFMPHGAAITQGMIQGMLAEAKGRMKSAMGTMAGAVESAMGKVRSAAQSGMDRVRGESAKQASAAGAEAATAHADGMSSEDRQAERAARKLWRRAYKELMDGVGAARFLGEEWSREFWEGMLDSSGTLAFAQFVTTQIVNAAEDAVMAAMGAVAGLTTQLEIVGSSITDLEGDITSLADQLATMDAQAATQAQTARVNAVREELRLQQELTRILEDRFKAEFSAAHQAHIRAAQTGSVVAQAEYEAKLRQAQATDSAIAESKIRETELQTTLDAMLAAIEQAVQDELAARRQAIAEELAMKRQLLAEEQAMQEQLLAAQLAAQLDYTQAVIDGSTDRIKALEKELKKASGAEQKAEIRAQIALEQQRIQLAQELAVALQAQSQAGTAQEIAETAAQVQFLTAQIQALGEVDVSSLLSEIVSDLEAAATALGSSATAMSSAADALGSTAVTEPMAAASGAVAEFGTEAGIAARGADSMAAAYDKALAGMNEDAAAFNAQFEAMVQKTQGAAEAGGAAIGDALSTGITERIQGGAPALQKTMLDSVQQGVDQTEQAADTGATDIAGTFGQSMRDKLGVELPKIHQDILTGMNKATTATTQDAAQGGKAVGDAYSTNAKQKLDAGIPKFQQAMSKGVTDGVRDVKREASQGGESIGAAMSDGIKKGIDDRAQGIANAAAKTVADAMKAARNKAEAKSPSKRMMELGDDMGLGLILGIEGRHSGAMDASERLVHIPEFSPTSGGGVSGRRAMEERRGTIVHIERLELPGVRDPEQFIAAMEDIARTAGVSSGRN